MPQSKNIIERSPVVAIMGHVDHGKSTLLDYIRKTNIVEHEAGGITQHISTYEVTLKDGKKITFLDTPGHAAFDQMRNRGGGIADIAILIVSADDSVKMQTRHAIEVIKKNNIPFIVAINKIDKPEANIEKVKTDLLEEGIYVEGFGGDVPFVPISAKKGTGVDDLLESLVILAEMEELKGDLDKPASGFVVESYRDPREGITATLVIKDGSLHKGQYVVAEESVTSTRMLRDFSGENIDSAFFSSPIRLVGFDKLPSVGSHFETFETKKEAEHQASEYKHIKEEIATPTELLAHQEGVAIIPVILKTDVSGTGEAIADEIKKITDDEVIFKIIKNETGAINESDIKLALSDPHTIIIGFHVDEESNLKNLNGYEIISIQSFDIIYNLTEWLLELYDKRRIKKEVRTVTGSLKILKIFSQQKNKLLMGGSLISGELKLGDRAQIKRNNEVITETKIIALQQGKITTEKITGEGTECGIMVDSHYDIHEGDILESFILEIK